MRLKIRFQRSEPGIKNLREKNRAMHDLMLLLFAKNELMRLFSIEKKK